MVILGMTKYLQSVLDFVVDPEAYHDQEEDLGAFHDLLQAYDLVEVFEVYSGQEDLGAYYDLVEVLGAYDLMEVLGA